MCVHVWKLAIGYEKVFLRLNSPVHFIFNLFFLEKGQLYVFVIRLCLDPRLCCSIGLDICAGSRVDAGGQPHFPHNSSSRKQRGAVLLVWMVLVGLGGPSVGPSLSITMFPDPLSHGFWSHSDLIFFPISHHPLTAWPVPAWCQGWSRQKSLIAAWILAVWRTCIAV